VCIICHGRSNANAIKNAIRVAAEYTERRINERIEAELGMAHSKRRAPAPVEHLAEENNGGQ
jgi:glycerol-3-phosphate acyltransferase PlsX